MNSTQQTNRPRIFRATPDTHAYYPFSSIQLSLETAVRAIVRAEGPVAILGGAGYGKSLLAELLCEELADRLDIVKLDSARLCSRQALLQNILYELHLPYRDLSEGELRLSLLERLEPSPETAPDGILIVVDEAHTLHPKLLDELRLISNTTRNSQPRVRLALLGNLRLEETLASPILESFNQRIAARCYLQPMKRDETIEFIRSQFRSVGIEPDSCVTQEALQAVHAATEGIPRLVNQLMDHALVLLSERMGRRLGVRKISVDIVNEAWADLQQLPSPWTTKQAELSRADSGVPIEFGMLEDEIEEAEPNCADSSPPLSNHSYFSAFSDLDGSICEQQDCEHQDVDAMAIWENDPPLRRPLRAEVNENQPSALEWIRPEPNVQLSTEDLFGNDFELEQVVPVQVVDDANYLLRLQQMADALTRVSQPESEVERPQSSLADEREETSFAASSLGDQLWTLDVVPQPMAGVQIEESIEDMVSQLNFSAFQVEPFSLEQVPLESAKNKPIPADSIRTNERNQLVMLHRPSESNRSTGWENDLDDDRDILMIEEGIPASTRLLDENLPSEPAQKPLPYAQLFTRLRK